MQVVLVLVWSSDEDKGKCNEDLFFGGLFGSLVYVL